MEQKSIFEIMDFDKEFKRYIKLNKGKNQKYKYSSWKTHILTIIDELDTHTTDDMMFYCKNKVRTMRSDTNLYLNLVLLFVPIYIENMISDLNPIVLLFVFLAIFSIMVFNVDRQKRHEGFYDSLIEIIEYKRTRRQDD